MRLFQRVVVLALFLTLVEVAPAAAYRNPLPVRTPTGERLETFADPSVIRASDGSYYAYATSDPLNDRDRDESGALRIRRIPFARSTDLVHWTYAGEALTAAPAWAAPVSGLWAPDIREQNGRYLLYFTVTDTADAISGEPGCTFDPAIGVAVADSPAGPFTPTATPVVAPRRGGPGCNFLWTFDPAVTTDADGSRVLYYGSYYGGIEARRLAPDGLTTDPATARRITTGDRYEGAYVVRRRGWWYLMASSTDCCRGPLTGYSVFAGRARSPFGPFVDRLGVRLDDPRVGGTPVISMNGNRWIGTGHHAVITDEAGQDWALYHAVDRTDPYFSQPNPDVIQKRPMLLDRLTWRRGWPSVRNGRWASDERQPAPVTATHGRPSPEPRPFVRDRPGRLLRGVSDEFERGRLERRWSWVRTPAASAAVRPGWLRFPTQAGDLFEATNTASVLVRRAPRGDFMVETKFEFDLPPTGVFNFQQTGLLLYQGDDAFVKLTHVSIFETRQTEWAKEVPTPLTPKGQRYGNTVVGPPGLPGVPRTTTWLRIVRRADRGSASGEQRYTAYTSIDGRRWVRGGTWTHALASPQIGLVSMGGVGHTADFDYVRVYRLAGARRWFAPRRGHRVRDARPPRRAPRTTRSERPVRVREQLPARR
jgi:arabinan endo-1,5-alpha-L-arabinosidase